ncbi:MAG: restriction endonuclease [Myxococcota bacterium]
MPTQIDENDIVRDIESREYVIDVVEDWITPAGNYRKAPMYCATLENEFLGLSKIVKAKLRSEVEQKARRQLQTWANRELRERVAEAKQDLRERAAEMTRIAQEEVEQLRGTLEATLSIDDRIHWPSLLETREYAREVFEPDPEPNAPERTFLLYLWPPAWNRKVAQHQEELSAHRSRTRELKATHDQREDEAAEIFRKAKEEKNRSIGAFQAAFEAGQREAIEEYVSMVFERSAYPARLIPSIIARFDEESRTIIADISVPGPDDVSAIASYKLTDRNRAIAPVELKKREREDLYDSAIKQLALRVMHEVFESVYTEHVARVVANVWTTVIDKATGHDQTSCFLSVSEAREQFDGLNLARVDPTECIKQLKGLIAGPLSQVAPVQPIMTFNRDDPRFVESREMLAELNALTNLAEIPWEEFEHLVRELFAKMFSEHGAEVKVTRSSQDGGVDAVVFDPDPIRGGKFVIQAKRYTKAVPVSAVRDLYGTMLNEGAAKGLLVTTAHFGAQAREFAKDKPISLIDGSNLVYLLEQHGHPVRIDVEAARRNR